MKFDKDKLAMLVAEFIGTAFLALSALTLINTTSVAYFIATTVGLTLAILVMVLGPVSGGHFNPAVTFGLWTARKIDTLSAIFYIIVQMLGGFAALKVFEYLTDKTISTKSTEFDTPIWLAEVVGTFIFTMGIAAVITRGYDGLQKGVTIGASLFVGIIIAANASAGLLNPAIALSVKDFTSAYVLGPLLGAVLGFNLYMWLFTPKPKQVSTNSKTQKTNSKTRKRN